MSNNSIPVLAFVGLSKTGKTSLIESLIPIFCSKGIRVAVIKHHHLGFDIDIHGKDTHRFKQAGAQTVIISSPDKIAVIKDSFVEPEVEDIISRYVTETDIVIIEGYKKAKLPKIEVYINREDQPPLCLDDENLLAIVTDLPFSAHVPVFSRDDKEGISEFIFSHFTLRPSG